MLRLVSVSFLLLVSVIFVNGGNVLFLTAPAFSHLHRNLNLVKVLAMQYGHTSTVVLNDAFARKLPNESYIEYLVADSFNKLNVNTVGEELAADICSSNINFSWIKILFQKMQIFCKSIFEDVELIETLRKKSFDVVVIDSMVPSGCFNVLAHNLSIPRIQLGLPLHFVNWRIPFTPSLAFPIPLLGTPGDTCFVQRLKNVLVTLVVASVGDPFVPSDKHFTYSNDVTYKTVEELHATNALVLSDTDPVMDTPTPMMPNVIQVGGLNTRKPSDLHGPLLSFMDSSPEGVIVVSFGSLGWPLPANIMDIFISAFKKVPYLKFVFKYGDTIRYEENIMFLPWIPQNDLLSHRNTKAFVTHCGNNGQYEALYNGVPMIGIPVNGDQFHNAQRMHKKGFGIILDLCSADEKIIVDSVIEVLKEEYKNTISRASAIFHSRPMEPAVRAAFWVDHVIHYGGEYLRPPFIPFYQYYLLDIVLFFISVGILTMLLFIVSCYKCYRMCLSSKVKQD